MTDAGKEIATLAGGCFWCLEAVFDDLKGVESVESGYMGGKTANPSYEDVCSGETGHAEVVQLTFDPKQVSFKEILEVFFEQVMRNLGAAKIYDDPIVTEVVPVSKFYVAEDYHQEYFRRNPAQPYCAFIVRPKVAKFRKHFLEKLKK